jgi:hypothetical protein
MIYPNTLNSGWTLLTTGKGNFEKVLMIWRYRYMSLAG